MKKVKKVIAITVALLLILSVYPIPFNSGKLEVHARSVGDEVSPGSQALSTKVVITDNFATKINILLSDSENSVSVGGNSPADATTYVSGSDIIAGVAVGKWLNVYHLDNDNKLISYFSKQLGSEDIKNPFAGGDGTVANPYQIATAAQLAYVSDFAKTSSWIPNNFILNNDIDLNVAPYNIGEGWNPIQDFDGQFNGNNKTINNLMINRPNEDNVGLFAEAYGNDTKFINNLAVTNAKIIGKNSVGILIGFMTGAHIEKVYTSGEVAGSLMVGGLIGNIDNAPRTVINCYSVANVKGSGMIGGLVGTVTRSRIENSYAAGIVTLVNPNTEYYEENNGQQTKQYKDFVGGLIGANNPYGDNYGTNTLTSIYYDTNVSTQSDDGKGTKKSTADMKVKANFVNWDFDDIWEISPAINNGYPHFKSLPPVLSNYCDILTWEVPSEPTVSNLAVTKTVANATDSITVAATASANATWKLYSDAGCTQEIQNKVMNLSVGANTAYVKVTAQDGTTSKTYTLTVTREASTSTTVKADVIDKSGKSVRGVEAQVTTEANGTKTVKMKASEAVLVEQADGTKAPFSDASKLGFQVDGNANVSIAADGTITVNNLAKGASATISVTYDLGNGQKITVCKITVTVDSNGNTVVTSTLIDPYGTITDKTTGKIITGANVKLYYANTARNIAAGKTPDTLVPLPIINGFRPNDNKNPQISDASGAYGFMVFPNSDYYIVATKAGYEDFKSPTISVEKEIVKYDIQMTPAKVAMLVQTGSVIDEHLLIIVGVVFMLTGLFFVMKKKERNN